MYTVKVRLYPNKETYNLLYNNCNASRFIYNWGLENSIDYYNKTGKSLSRSELDKQLPQLKEKLEFLALADSTSLQQSLKNLNQAYQNFFRRVKKGENPGFPRFKSRFNPRQSFRCVMSNQVNGNKIKIGKYRNITFRCSKRDKNLLNNYKIRNVTVVLEDKHFYASILIDYDKPVSKTYQYKVCGIDVGVAKPFSIVYKDGDIICKTNGIKVKRRLEELEQKRKRLQIILSRKTKGSSNYGKIKSKINRVYQKERNVRKDFTEKFTTQLSNKFKAVVLEDLKLQKMTKSAKGTLENPGKNVKAKSGLNRELLRLGFGNFKQRLIDKQKARNHFVVLINPRFTSQICSNCGHRDKNSRISQSEFKCVKCGFEINADYNAAINIRSRGIKVLKGNTKLGKVA